MNPLAPVAATNWAPAATLLLVAASLALLPLAWVLWRTRSAHAGAGLMRLRWVTFFLTFDLLVFGAFTRLTDSGLGCPDWPGCYGASAPIGARQAIHAAQAALPDGPVTVFKAWVEMLHRYLAMTVGALILVQAVLDWRARRHPTHSPWRWSLAALVWVCIQGAFGAWTVTLKLMPLVVTLHWLGALTLLVLLWRPALQGDASATLGFLPPAAYDPRAVPTWALALTALLVAQLALGAWVSTNYAVLVCTDFPRCQGQWWPAMDVAHALQLWRPLGLTAAGDALPIEALTAIHYSHRLLAYVVLVGLGAWAWRLNRRPGWRAASRVLAGLVGLQLATGMANVVLNWPLPAALLHSAGAAALLLVAVGVVLRGSPTRLGERRS